MEIFLEISIVIIIATVVSIIMRALKQPLIIGYILTGLISGPYLFNIIQSSETIEIFSKIGVVILLFIVGLNLNPQAIKEVGKVSIVSGIAQVLLTTLIGFFIAISLGLDRTAALYVGLALTFSSTIIILKLLSDKGDINAFYAKIIIGLLVVQDIIATVALVIISSLEQTSQIGFGTVVALTLLKGTLLTVGILFVSNYVIKNSIRYIAQSQELLFLFSLGWGLSIATLFLLAGFSVEIGALVAGVTLSVTPYAHEISSRLKPLRDFFVLLFFILLGSQITFTNLESTIIPIIVLSLFVLIGNPLIMVIIMNLLGFSKKIGFKAGLTVAQVSEFSLILATLGFQLGQINQEVLSIITIVALITIGGSAYLIMHDELLYAKLSPYLSLLEFRKNRRQAPPQKLPYEVVLFGYHRVGKEFVKAFKKNGRPFVVVDFNPESIRDLDQNNVPYKYGDAEDVEFLEDLELKNVKLFVSTIPEDRTSKVLVKTIRRMNKKAIIMVLSHTINNAQELYKLGANYVIMPHYLGAQYAAQLITDLDINDEKFKKEKKHHLEYLEKHFL
ncbi:MAG: cation:proton antiporter [bacterium]|nr:cation:proton antiporter [bacterium]